MVSPLVDKLSEKTMNSSRMWDAGNTLVEVTAILAMARKRRLATVSFTAGAALMTLSAVLEHRNTKALSQGANAAVVVP